MTIPNAKAAVEHNAKTRENTSVAADESQKKERRDRWSKVRRQNSALGSLSSQEFGVGINISKIQKSSGAPRWNSERWFRLSRSVYRAKFIRVTDDSCKCNGCLARLPGCAGQAADAQYQLTPKFKWKMLQNYWKFLKSSRFLQNSTTRQVAKIMVQHGRPSRSSRKESFRSSSGKTFMWKSIREILLKYGWEKVYNWEYTLKKDHSCLCTWTT